MKNIITYQEIAVCTGCQKETEVTTYHVAKEEPLSLCPQCKRTYQKKNSASLRHNVTAVEYKQMFVDQKGVCAVCGEKETGKSRSQSIAPLAIDHNHTTGQVRGLLCRACNTALGLMREDPERILALIEYIKKYQ